VPPKELPKSDFDPFSWRAELSERFEKILKEIHYLFDANGRDFIIVGVAEKRITPFRIEKIRYKLKRIR
jgi:hypothetical protein